LFEPGGGFVGFEFEFGDGLDGVAGWDDFGVLGRELERGVDSAGQGAVCFFIETGTDGFDGVGEQGVVLVFR